MNAPAKPFPTYKWRWLSVQPTEGLLDAPVFLGILRALHLHEGDAYRSIELQRELLRVQKDARTDVKLARDPDRNLFRNSGQYWRGTGLLLNTHGKIELTSLGHSVASGEITKDEFAALMVRNTVLPNPRTYSESELGKWRDAGLRIKPFDLILSIMNGLGRNGGLDQAYLTPNELILIIIPLAGAKTSVDEIINVVHLHRHGRFDISGFPNCAVESNDKRLAREFLLFLRNFGICQGGSDASGYDQKFILDEVFSNTVESLDQASFLEDEQRTDDEVSASKESEIPIIIERRRIASSTILRPGQGRFRNNVLKATGGQCILTQEASSDVIEAAHIIPVRYGGTDSVGNGLCMRVDIHRLFDNGKIRISPHGTVTLNEQISTAVSYRDLPQSVNFPPTVGLENIEWRSRYL